MAVVLEHMGNFGRGDAREGKRWEGVFGEELSAGSFVAVLGRTTAELGEEEEFVGMEGVGRMAVEIAVVESGELGDVHFVAGLLAGFPGRGDRWGFADIGPATGESPTAIFELTNEEDAVFVEGGDAHVHFGCGIAGLLGKKIADGRGVRKRPAGSHHLRCYGPNFFVAWNIELIGGIG